MIGPSCRLSLLASLLELAAQTARYLMLYAHAGEVSALAFAVTPRRWQLRRQGHTTAAALFVTILAETSYT